MPRSLGLDPRDLEDDRVLYYHDVPPEVVEKRCSSIRSSRARRSVSRGHSNSGPTSRRASCPAATTASSRGVPARVAQERLGITPDIVPGGHMVALSNPHGLADWLDRYAATDLRPA
jgi:hypothetical protein